MRFRFSVIIPEKDTHKLFEILGAIGHRQLVAMHNELMQVRARFIYDTEQVTQVKIKVAAAKMKLLCQT